MPDSYKIHEIFYSLQGEGANTGKPVVFVRFAGCNLSCDFCDTPKEKGRKYTAQQIKYEALLLTPRCKRVIFTGGEPLLQLNEGLIRTLRGWWLGLETNGTLPPPKGLDYITLSPKGNVHQWFWDNLVNEVRVVLKRGQRPDGGYLKIKATHYYVSPIFNGVEPTGVNIEWCIRFCLENPQWDLSVQTHKLLGIK